MPRDLVAVPPLSAQHMLLHVTDRGFLGFVLSSLCRGYDGVGAPSDSNWALRTSGSSGVTRDLAPCTKTTRTRRASGLLAHGWWALPALQFIMGYRGKHDPTKS